MNITMVGTGYVGLVTAACLAESGNWVTCLDIEEEKIRRLTAGQLTVHEPGLEALVLNNRDKGRLLFTTNPTAISASEVVFLTVGTPPGSNGAPDLTALMKAIQDIAPYLAPNAVVVVKSTVPVGTNARIEKMLREILGRFCDVISNPEFLSEGSAVRDFMQPNRIIVGVRRPSLGEWMRELYKPFLQQGGVYLAMSVESAELTKYAANALLAARVAYINEIATICDAVGAEISDVRQGIGTDHRIGFEFLAPGPGYGGSCFPKDVKALENLACEAGIRVPLIEAIDASNKRQKLLLENKIKEHFHGELRGRTIALWGLAFKAGTDDVRESPALTLIEGLVNEGANLRVHDPAAMRNVHQLYGNALTYCESPTEALLNAAALVVLTEWDDYRVFEPEDIIALMASPTIFDGRYLFNSSKMQQAGIDYHALGDGVAFSPAGCVINGGS